MKKGILVGLGLLVLGVACIEPLGILRSLVWGWLIFLVHTLPRMKVDRPSVFAGCLAVVLFSAGVHAVGRTWRRDAPEEPRWKFRWTLATVAVVFLLFACGISLVGIVHQAGWLLASPEPYYVQTVRTTSFGSSVNSRNNLKQLGLGVAIYSDIYGSSLPGGSFTSDGRMLHSWETSILFHFNYSTIGLGGDIDYTLPWNHPHNERFFKSILPELINPSLPAPPVLDEQGFGLSHYSANSRVMGANKSMSVQDIRDGTSATLLIGEVNANFKPWGHPVNWRDPAKGINRSPRGFGGAPYAGGANFSMADGSVRFVSERIDPDVLRALSTPAGGEAIDASVLGPPR